MQVVHRFEFRVEHSNLVDSSSITWGIMYAVDHGRMNFAPSNATQVRERIRQNLQRFVAWDLQRWRCGKGPN